MSSLSVSRAQSPRQEATRGTQSPRAAYEPVAEVFDWYASFELSAQTRVRAPSDAGSMRPALPRPAARHAPPAQTTPGQAPTRGVLYRAVWHVWDLALVKPLQALAALLGVLAGMAVVIVQASWSVLCSLGKTLYDTFCAAFERVVGPGVIRIDARAQQGIDAVEQENTPMPSPEIGGRTPSPLASASGVMSPVSPLTLSPIHTPQTSRAPSPLPSPPPSPTGTPFDAIPVGLPEGRPMPLPDAICATCGEVVAPGAACAHVASEQP